MAAKGGIWQGPKAAPKPCPHLQLFRATMGILDDAIREHLELKRQHGAEDEDLERLENEAFGPAARPGDPDFAEPAAGTGEQPAAAEPPSEESPTAADPPSEEIVVEPIEAPPEEPPAAEQPSDEGSATAAAPPAEAAPAAADAPSGSFGIFDAEAEVGGEAEEIPADATPAERARIEHAHLDDTVDHPAPAEAGDKAKPSTDVADVTEPVERERPAEPEPEPEAAAEPTEPAAAPEAPESDIFAGEDFGLEEMDLSISDEPESGAQSTAGEDDADGDDLLEETPDFLQETEGEDLWFEQGPPRDFDFDDD